MTDADNATDNDELEESDMSTATAPSKPTTATARILDVLGDAEGPLTVEQISKLTDVKQATLDRALRKMLKDRAVVKTTEDNVIFYGIPPKSRTKGEISQQIIAFLSAHPGEDFSPYKIAKEIERFPGSVAWTCAAMLRRQELVQVSSKPLTYTLP